MKKNIFFDEDKKFIIQSIKDRVRSYQYEQIDRKAGVFSRNIKSMIPQPTLLVQSQPIPVPLQQLTTLPLIAKTQIAPVPTPAIIPPPSAEISQN